MFLSPYTVTQRFSGECQQKYVRVFCSPQPDKLSATLLVLWLCFLLILVIHNVPNTIFDIIFKESNECKFLILQAMCSCSGKWEGNGYVTLTRNSIQTLSWFCVCLQQAKLFQGVMISFHECSFCANLTLYAKTPPSMCLTVIPNVYKVFNYIQIYRVYFS